MSTPGQIGTAAGYSVGVMPTAAGDWTWNAWAGYRTASGRGASRKVALHKAQTACERLKREARVSFDDMARDLPTGWD